MKRFDVHDEVCEIVIEIATIVAILESDSKAARRPHNPFWLDRNRQILTKNGTGEFDGPA
jgi:hypothetical protein